MADPEHDHPVREATAADVAVVAELLDAFNREFDTPTPGAAVLARRLPGLLAGQRLVALLTGDRVQLLDEFFARRITGPRPATAQAVPGRPVRQVPAGRRHRPI